MEHLGWADARLGPRSLPLRDASAGALLFEIAVPSPRAIHAHSVTHTQTRPAAHTHANTAMRCSTYPPEHSHRSACTTSSLRFPSSKVPHTREEWATLTHSNTPAPARLLVDLPLEHLHQVKARTLRLNKERTCNAMNVHAHTNPM